MKTKLISRLKQNLNFGITDDDTYFNVIRIRIYNSLLFSTLAAQLVITVGELVQSAWDDFFIVLFNLILTSSLILLNKSYKTRVSIFIFHIFYPLMNLLLVFTYNSPNNIEYTFILFLITVFLLHQGLVERLLMSILPLIFLIYTKYGGQYIGYMGRDLDHIANFMMLLGPVLIILLVLLSLAWELRKYDDKIRKLLIELETKNEEMLDKNKELERFSYIVSHDMKTPLRAVAGYINILEKRLKDENKENLRYLNYIKENATQLNSLVVQTLEFSKIDNEKIVLEPIDVNQILFKLSRDFITKDIQVYTTDTFPQVLGNRVLVNKVFQNLIENGGKYNNSAEKIIEISAEIKLDKITFAIKDNGIGINEKYHTQIFEMYKRLHTKKEYVGTGLGLSICKKIAKQLEGDIYLKSKLEEGSIFYFELKLAQEEV